MGTQGPLNLDALLGRARDGEPGAFAELVAAMGPSLIGYCRRMTGEAALAEDLAQDCLVKLSLSLAAYDRRRPARPYVYRIAHNLCIDHLRRGRLPAAPAWADSDPPAAPDGGPGVDPETLASRAEVQAAVDRAFAALPPAYRSAALLTLREGLSYEEVAAVLHQPIGTVKSSIHRARQHLQQFLAPYV